VKAVVLVALCVLGVFAQAGNVAGQPLFSEGGKQAVILSPLERWMPTWNMETYVAILERAGYQVEIVLNENVSISFLRTQLAKYDLIILRTDSFAWEGFNFFCSGESATVQAKKTYVNEIAARELDVAACVGFSMLFLRSNYRPGSLRPGLVFGVGGGMVELSPAFKEAGMAVFIGYDDMYSLSWGRVDALSQKLLRYMSEGTSVKNSVSRLYQYLTIGHGRDASLPSVYWTGNGDFTI
jgi:hypothetical protein